MADQLCYLGLAEAARLIRNRHLGSRELVQACIDRYNALPPHQSAFIDHQAEFALAAADDCDRNDSAATGILAGIPLVLKDNHDVVGRAYSGGSLVLPSDPAPADSSPVRQLKSAGAIIVGFANMHELGFGASNINRHFGTPANPWDRERVPGGSSGGTAAAVAAGMAAGGTGTDAGGSIRTPAAHCGICGHKPTFGLVAKYGVLSLTPSQGVVGPLARSAEDLALLLTALTGHDRRDPYSVDVGQIDHRAGLKLGVGGRRLAVPTEHFFDDLPPEIVANVEAAISVWESLGAEIHRVPTPWAAPAVEPNRQLTAIEAAHQLRHLMADDARFSQLAADVQHRLLESATATSGRYLELRDRMRALTRAAEDFFDDYDALITPTNYTTAGRADNPDLITEYLRMDAIPGVFNLTRQPSVAIPSGFDSQGLPTSVLISTRQFGDAMALRIAQAFQQVTDFHARVPTAVG
ncbi:MAG: amidase [Chloroflexi bacterium]|nr:amidase [Chloroflexota bacterium]